MKCTRICIYWYTDTVYYKLPLGMMMKPRAYHNLIQEIQLITPTEVGQTVVMPLQTYVRRASDFKKELQDKANIGGAVHHMALTSFAECPDSMMENPLKPPCRMKPISI